MTHPDRPLMSVLVVDDNHDAAESCALLLGMLGHEVRVAGSCREALAAVETFAPAAVVLDLGLPDGDGYQLAAKLVAALARRPLLVALTGHGNKEAQARAAGFDHYLLKPVEPAVLAGLLARHGRHGGAGEAVAKPNGGSDGQKPDSRLVG